jgi:hypothetical protein
MTNNTIPNVPRDWFDRVHALLYKVAYENTPEGLEAECLGSFIPSILSATSPAGVDGLEVETYLHTLHMELGQTEQFFSEWKGDPFGVSGVDYSSTYSVTSEPLCRLSDAKAIIDGLRGEVAKINSDRLACWAEFKVMTRACLDAEKERDQQAQRIGELEWLFSEVTPEMSSAGHAYYQQAIADHGDFTPTGMFKAMVSAICVGKEQA